MSLRDRLATRKPRHEHTEYAPVDHAHPEYLDATLSIATRMRERLSELADRCDERAHSGGGPDGQPGPPRSAKARHRQEKRARRHG